MRVYHWWPGREYRGACPIPSYLVQDAKRKGSLYMTFAVEDTNRGPIAGCAQCCPKDVPSRKMGRQIAIGRLRALMEDFHLEPDHAVSRF
jgi:hypothetical protein